MTTNQPNFLGPERQYFNYLNSGEWRIQQCQSCKKAIFYPRIVCPYCQCEVFSWVKPSGKGVVYAFTSVSRKPEAGGFHNVSLIDLDEGVRLMSRVENIAHTDVYIGMEVKVVLPKSGQTGAQPVFHPISE